MYRILFDLAAYAAIWLGALVLAARARKLAAPLPA
jgi:hypothetical protein